MEKEEDSRSQMMIMMMTLMMLMSDPRESSQACVCKILPAGLCSRSRYGPPSFSPHV